MKIEGGIPIPWPPAVYQPILLLTGYLAVLMHLDLVLARLLFLFAFLAPIGWWLLIGKYGVFEDEEEREGWNRAVIGSGALSICLILATSRGIF